MSVTLFVTFQVEISNSVKFLHLAKQEDKVVTLSIFHFDKFKVCKFSQPENNNAKLFTLLIFQSVTFNSVKFLH